MYVFVSEDICWTGIRAKHVIVLKKIIIIIILICKTQTGLRNHREAS